MPLYFQISIAVCFVPLAHSSAAADFASPYLLSLLQKDSPCSDKPDVTEGQCLSKTAASCMWLELEDGNLCLPCNFHGVDIPCAPMGSVFAMRKVKQCNMKCAHQEIVTKVSACTDLEGTITNAQCFSKGVSALTNCMWTTYTDKNGKDKNVCGPCAVEGIGKIPPYAPGNEGPEGPGSTVNGCASMCDSPTTEFGMPCGGGVDPPVPAVTPCHPTAPPPPPPMAPVPLEVMRIQTSDDAPEYFAVPVNAPYGPKQYTEASEVAAQTAGWPAPGEDLPPDAPVMIYGTPPFEGPTLPPTLKVMYGPAPPGLPGVPPPGYGMGTAPPPENVAASEAQNAFLAIGRHIQKMRDSSHVLDNSHLLRK